MDITIWSISQSDGFTAELDSSHEIKRQLLPRRKVMTDLLYIKKAEMSLCKQMSI